MKAPKPEARYLEFDEAERLVEAAKSEPLWYAMIVVALNTGLRVGELLALRWGDLDLRRGEMQVRRSVVEGHIDTPKSGKPRKIPLNDTVVGVLKAHQHLRSELVFCQDDGSMLTDGQIQELLGHSTIEVTMRYAHFSPVGLKAAVAALDRPSSTPTAQEPAADRKPALALASNVEN